MADPDSALSFGSHELLHHGYASRVKLGSLHACDCRNFRVATQLGDTGTVIDQVPALPHTQLSTCIYNSKYAVGSSTCGLRIRGEIEHTRHELTYLRIYVPSVP
jgi:hypothetical protein